MNARRWYRRLTVLALAMTFVVIVLGAWVRLTDAGLGCPDWPGCYGHLTVPDSAEEVIAANEAYPERPVSEGKAWREMIHRYVAGTLGLVILAIAVLAVANRRDPDQAVALPLVLLGVVTFQALLGMWTVTLLLKPAIVLAHLLGGMTTFGLLWWMVLKERSAPGPGVGPALRAAALAGLVVVGLQIALGGWTSTNYAALACPDFPTCQTRWWPDTDFSSGFTVWRGLGVDYEGGVLDNPSRVAIHLAHRIGAVVTLVTVGLIGFYALTRARDPRMRRAAAAVTVALAAQIVIGVTIVLLHLPLPLAVAHNGTAALLLLAVLWLNYAARPKVLTGS